MMTTLEYGVAALSIIGMIIAFFSARLRALIFYGVHRILGSVMFAFLRRTYLDRSLGDALINYLQASGWKIKRFTSELYGEAPAFITSEGEVKHVLYRDFNANTQLFYKKGCWPVLVSGAPLVQVKDRVKSYSYIAYTVKWSINLVKLLDDATEAKNIAIDEENAIVPDRFIVKHVSGSRFTVEKKKDANGNEIKTRDGANETILKDPFSSLIPIRWSKDNIGREIPEKNTLAMMSLNPELEDALEEIRFWFENAAWYKERGILHRRGYAWVGNPGTGKCLGIGTPVLKYDGSIVPVETIVEGDLLMGPDNEPRQVQSTTRDRGELFKIKPHKGNEWVCNDVHILTLIDSVNSRIYDVPLDYYLELVQKYGKDVMARFQQFKAPIRGMNEDDSRTGFEVESIGKGEYAGFTLDSDGRFLLGDFTVTHNTMFTRALAEHLNVPLIIFDLASMNNSELIAAWGMLLPGRIALFEDIDTVFHGRENIVAGSELTFDALLNILDGADKKSGVLQILTTNHPEYLDPALCGALTKAEMAAGKISSRPGRIDRVVEFLPLDASGRRKLVMRIVRDEKMADVICVEGAKDSPAQLQERAFRAAIDVLFKAREVERQAKAKAAVKVDEPAMMTSMPVVNHEPKDMN